MLIFVATKVNLMSAYQEQSDIQSALVNEEECALILHNDFNTFEHVIHCLVNIMGQEPLQAEQCAFIVHYKGKCTSKKGKFETLNPFHRILAQQGLTVSIDQ